MRKTLMSLIATIGLLLTGLAAPVLLAPAGAATATDGSDRAARAASPATAQARADKPMRKLHDKIVKKRGKLYFKGRVSPSHGPVYVQKKTCAAKKCKWKSFKKVRTHGPKAKWQVRVYAPKHGNWYWRAYVKSTPKYAKSWSNTYKTYTTRF